MIFIILGSQKFQFNRLLIEIDRLIEESKITDKVFAQIGYSDYKPKNYDYIKFLDKSEFEKKIESCDLVITHGGTGAIISAIKKDKKVIAIPRLAKFNEHVDDHQLQIVEEFEKLNFISKCKNINKLESIYNRTLQKDFNKYYSNTNKIIESIELFLVEIS